MTIAPNRKAALDRAVGEQYVRTDEDSLRHYGRDSCDLFEPAPSAVVFPASTAEVKKLVLLASEHALALVPSGGRTGLSGGATASNGEVIVSLERMNRILGFDPVARTVRCQAGVVTARLHELAGRHGLFYPVDFAATGSSHISGNIATNAGGNRVIRYGMTRNWVLGLEVVSGAGEVLDLNRGLLKNNAGYDLRHLFIGSEGTLGFVTEATLQLIRAPYESAVMVLGASTLPDILSVLEAIQSSLTLNAFEFFSEDALSRVIERHGLQRPFDTRAPLYALAEFELRSGSDMEAAVEAFEACRAAGWVLDGTVSQSRRQAQELWRLRDDISETLSRWSPYKNDLSVSVSRVPEFLDEVGKAVEDLYPDFEVLWYGHIGDGNVHLNILKPEELDLATFKARCAAASEHIFAVVQKYGGSISAEHGVGLLKKPFLAYCRAPEEIELLKSIKAVLDPGGVMNPGKIFD